MSQQNPLSPQQIQELKDTVRLAEEQLVALVDYKRAGIDVKIQEDKLNEVITNGKKILAVWGN